MGERIPLGKGTKWGDGEVGRVPVMTLFPQHVLSQRATDLKRIVS